jgi:hypothetical protein
LARSCLTYTSSSSSKETWSTLPTRPKQPSHTMLPSSQFSPFFTSKEFTKQAIDFFRKGKTSEHCLAYFK